MKPIFAAIVVSMLAGACAYDGPPPPPPPRPGPGPGPGAGPGPGPGGQPGFVFVGRVVEKAGRCHTIRANNGRRFAVDRGVLAGIPVGARVRVRAVSARRQNCPGAQRVQVRRMARI